MQTPPSPAETPDRGHRVEEKVSWHCIGSSPMLRFALGVEHGGKVSDIKAEIWREASTGGWLWKAGRLTGCEPTREYAARAAEDAMSCG